jgi:hypothetical protein
MLLFISDDVVQSAVYCRIIGQQFQLDYMRIFEQLHCMQPFLYCRLTSALLQMQFLSMISNAEDMPGTAQVSVLSRILG